MYRRGDGNIPSAVVCAHINKITHVEGSTEPTWAVSRWKRLLVPLPDSQGRFGSQGKALSPEGGGH